MQQLLKADLAYVVRNIPSDLRKLMREYQCGRLFIAGGFIRELIAGNKVQDVDVFGKSVDRLRDAAELLTRRRDNARMHESQYAFTVLSAPRVPVQFITNWLYDDAEQLLAELDFTICQAAVWFDGQQWQSMCSDRFYPDLAARRLYYTFPKREEAAGGSMMRVRKFLARGYNIQAESLAGVMSRVLHKVHHSGLAHDGEQGMAKVVAGLLREVDPLMISDSVDFIDETQDDTETS